MGVIFFVLCADVLEEDFRPVSGREPCPKGILERK